MGNFCGTRPAAQREEKERRPEKHESFMLHHAHHLADTFHEIQHLHIADFTPTNMGHYARGWLDVLALPFPVSLGLLLGGCLGSLLGLHRFLFWMVVFFGIAPVIYKSAMTALGKKVKDYLELVDRDYLGVDIHIGELDMCLCYARFVINDFQLDNPKGYNSDYLLKCSTVVLDIDVLELLMSKGKKIVVEEFTLDGVDVILEYDSVVLGAGKSNFDVVMEFVANKKEDAKKVNEPEKPKKDQPKKDDPKAEPAAESKREVDVQKVQIVDVGARVMSSIGLGPRAAVADTRYNHFTEQFKTSSTQDIIGIIFKSIFKSLIANVAGKAMADKSL